MNGCAHSIIITPESDKLPHGYVTVRSDKIVGYVITDEERNRRVITPGGGGDKVEYAPYKELEGGLYRVLNNVFTNVYSLTSMEDKAFITEKGIVLVMRPTIATNTRYDFRGFLAIHQEKD